MTGRETSDLPPGRAKPYWRGRRVAAFGVGLLIAVNLWLVQRLARDVRVQGDVWYRAMTTLDGLTGLDLHLDPRQVRPAEGEAVSFTTYLREVELAFCRASEEDRRILTEPQVREAFGGIDAWDRPLRAIRAADGGLLVYSMGRNGIDEQGQGDDLTW